MADAVTPAPAATAAPGTATNEPDDSQTFQVTREDWDKTQRTLNSLAAMLRKQTATQATPATPAKTVTSEPNSQQQALEQLQSELKAQKAEIAREKAIAESRIRTAGIRSAIQAHGITDGDAIEVLFDHIDKRHGDKLKTDGERITHTDDLGESKDIGEFIGEILRSPKGKLFKPEKVPGPNTRAAKGSSAPIPGQKSYMEMSMDERLKLTPEQRLAAIKGGE